MVKQSFLILEVFLFQYQQIERVDFSVESKSIFLLQVEGSFLPFIGLVNSDWPKKSRVLSGGPMRRLDLFLFFKFAKSQKSILHLTTNEL